MDLTRCVAAACGLFLVGVVTYACATTDGHSPAAPLAAIPADVVLTGAQAGTVVTLVPGQVLAFPRPGDAGSRWTVSVEPTILSPLFSQDPGTSAPDVFRFQAQKSGDTDLSFTQIASSQGQMPPPQARRFTFSIHVEERPAPR